MGSVPGKSFTEKTSRRTALTVTGLATESIQNFFWWQKLALDFSIRSNEAVAAAQSRVLDLAASQAKAAVEASASLFTGAVSRWSDAVAGVLDDAAKISRARQRGADWGRIEKNWHEYRAHIRERWDRLSDDDLSAVNGRRDELSSALQRKYGLSRDEAVRQVEEFARQQEEHAGQATSAGGI